MGKKRRRPANPVTPRPLNEGENIRGIIRDELTKALALPPGTRTTSMSTGYLQQLAMQGNMRGSQAAALTRDPYDNGPFGPGEPLIPAPFDPPLASGRPAPRRWEYPASINLQIDANRAVPWSVLRDAADKVSVMRSCIEVVKSTITGLEWSFGIDTARARHLAKRTGDSPHTVASDLADKYADDIDRLHTFWLKPDRINNWTFSEWLGALLEDQLVLDAVAVYPHLTMGGDLHSLELLDSTTIKVLQDHRGATPQPPLAAYQQILWGFPRSEMSQSPPEHVDAEFVSAVYGPVTGESAKTDALIYKVRNRRTKGPYGYSNVEQALTDVDLWLRRYDWLRSEYQSGVTPEMIIQVDANMTPEQLRQYEAVFNDDLSGQTAERHRARFLPAGFNASYPGSVDSKFTSDFDLHIIKLICAAFDVLPSSLGFSPIHGMGGMGSQGHMAQEQDTQLYRATKPTAQWIVDIINEVCSNYLGMPDEVTFQFHGLDAADEKKEADLLTGYIGAGLETLNEGRDQLNLPRYTFPEANEPMVVTPTGPAWLNVEVQPVGMPGNLPSAAQNQPGYQQQPVAPAKPAPAKPARDEQVPDGKKAEQKAFMAFARNRAGQAEWRDFTFKAFEPEVGEAANRLAAAGDTDAVKALFEMAGAA